jgi:soluble lytic murein transglycosylase-like protein
MATGGYPILTALRDVGTGIRGALESEAQNRLTDLQSQRETNQLTLQQAQLANQAKVQEAHGTLALAQQQQHAQEFGVTTGQKQQALDTERATQQATQQYQQGQLDVARSREAREARTAQTGTWAEQQQAAHQKNVLGLARERLELDQDKADEDKEPKIPFEDLMGHLNDAAAKSSNPEVAQAHAQSATAAAETLYPNILRGVEQDRDPTTGKHMITASNAAKLVQLVISMSKIPGLDAKAKLDAAKEAATVMLKTNEGRPGEEIMQVATAMTSNNRLYTQRVMAEEKDLKNFQASELNKYLAKNGGKPLTADDKQEFRRQYQGATGVPAPAQESDWNDLPAWQAFVKQKLITSGAKAPDKDAQAKLDAQANDAKWQSKVRISNEILGGMPVQPQPGPATPAPQAAAAGLDAPQRQGAIAIAHKEAATAGVDPRQITALIDTESSFRPQAVSPVGAQGLMQLMPETQKDYGVTNPFDIAQNIHGGTLKWRDALQKAGGDPVKAYSMSPGGYNPGASAQDIARFKVALQQHGVQVAAPPGVLSRVLSRTGGYLRDAFIGGAPPAQAQPPR